LDGTVVAEATEEAGAEVDDVLALGEVVDGVDAYCCGVVARLGGGSLKAKDIVENIIS
jgi:hypothetical protein